MTPASKGDWSTEYLDAIISARVVAGLDEAIALAAHAHGTQVRQCAIASEITYLVELNPDITAEIRAQLEAYKNDACSFTPIP